MKRIGWLLSKLGSRRKSVRPVRAAEFLEVRALMDATMPELMAEVFTTEVTDGEVSPEVDPVAVEGEPTVFTIDMVKRTLTPTSEETTEETPVEKAEPVLLDAENPDVIFYSLGGESPAAPPVTLSHFESREQFGEYLIERALARYEYQFGQAAWWNRGPVYYDAVGGDVFFTAAANDSVVRSHSETNTQVNGVDEGDVVETDGTHLYLLRNDELLIVNGFPADAIEEVARVKLEGYAIAEYLDGDRLTVISQQYDYGNDIYSRRLSFNLIARPSTTQTIVSVFDVSDPANPELAKQTTIDGNYVDSRAINGQVHVITSQDVSLPGPITDGTTTIQQPIYYYGYPQIVDDFAIRSFEGDALIEVEPAMAVEEPVALDAETLDIQVASFDEFALFRPIDDYEIQYQDIEVPVYESRESYLERMRANLDEFIDEALPHYLSQTAEGFAAEGLISEITAITKVDGSIYESLVSVVSIDTRDLQPGLVSSSSVFTDYTQGIYANAEHLYLFSPNYSGDSVQTNVLEFNWANGEREIELIGTGTIAGSLLNQFSADEFEGRLRVATTSSDYIDGVFTQTNQVCVYENIDGQLSPVGSTEGFANNERIYSVRFDGDRAFVVTFRQTDPLFVIDLSDPTAPSIEGELQVPGYSGYLQVIDRDHLLAVGRDTQTQATKVSLYDISDPQNPTEVDNDVLPRWTWSQAEWDHHAVGYFAEHSTLAIPTAGYDYDSQSYRNQLLDFSIDVTQTGEDAITLRGSIDDDNTVSRGLYIDNVLYAVGYDSVIAAEITNPKNILGRIDLAATAETFSFDDEPIFTESDDGAVDWEYLNLAESRADNELLAALGAINNLTGQVRVTLQDSAGTTGVTLADGQVTVVSEGLETQVITIGEGTSLVVNGTDRRDVIEVDFSEPGEVALTSILVLGNEGNDVITVNGLADEISSITTFSGDAGNDRLTVGSTVTTGVRLSGGDGRDSLTGGVGRDWLHGGAGHDLLNGGRGSDQLFGAAGRDVLLGGAGNDLLSGGGANDTLNGGSGNDSLDGGAGNDLLRGGVGNDVLRGGDGNDVLKGEDGNDILSGGAGNDRLMGGRGNDGLQGGTGSDYLAGEDGTDTLLGGDGNDVLRGGRGLDIALGEAGDDDVNGEQGVGDTVSGGEGTDIVRGRSIEIDETFSITPIWLDRV